MSSSVHCEDLDHCRTLWEIVRSCVLTVFACTWVSVHLNIPPSDEPRYYGTLRQLGIMSMAMIAPELVVTWAMRQWLAAKRLADLETLKSCGWTQTHCFYALMGGYIYYQGDAKRVLDLQNHEDQKLLFESQNSFSGLTEDEVTDKGKKDWLSKGLASIQTFWFLIQCIARATQRLPITELELATCGFAALNAITYWFWWDKPHGTRFASALRETQDWGSGPKTNVFYHLLGFVSSTHRREHSRRNAASGHCCLCAHQSSQKKSARHSFQSLSRAICLSTRVLGNLASTAYRTIVDTPFLHMIKHVDHEWNKSYVPTFYAGRLDKSDKVMIYRITAVISMIFGAIHCAGWSFAFPSVAEKLLWRICSVATTGLPAVMLLLWRVHDLLKSRKKRMCRDEKGSDGSGLVFTLVSWSLIICDVVVRVVVPLLYVLARIILLVVTLTSLRRLPSGVFQTVSWTDYIPHV